MPYEIITVCLLLIVLLFNNSTCVSCALSLHIKRLGHLTLSISVAGTYNFRCANVTCYYKLDGRFMGLQHANNNGSINFPYMLLIYSTVDYDAFWEPYLAHFPHWWWYCFMHFICLCALYFNSLCNVKYICFGGNSTACYEFEYKILIWCNIYPIQPFDCSLNIQSCYLTNDLSKYVIIHGTVIIDTGYPNLNCFLDAVNCIRQILPVLTGACRGTLVLMCGPLLTLLDDNVLASSWWVFLGSSRVSWVYEPLINWLTYPTTLVSTNYVLWLNKWSSWYVLPKSFCTCTLHCMLTVILVPSFSCIYHTVILLSSVSTPRDMLIYKSVNCSSGLLSSII